MHAAKRVRMEAARRRFFPHDALRATQRAERRATRALFELRQSNPQKYDAASKRASRSWADNAIRDAANASDKALHSAARWANDRLYEQGHSRLNQVGMGPTADTTKITREAIDLAANTPSGVYMSGAAGVEAANRLARKKLGRRVLPGGVGYGRGKKLVKNFEDTSALYAAARGRWGEAAKRAETRPLTTALELSGVKALVGRSVGAAGRAGATAVGKRGGGFASTSRPNLKLYTHEETHGARGPEVQREYSRDVINKGLQKAYERHVRKGSLRGRKTGTQRRPGRDPHVDVGTRLVPPNPLGKGRGSAPIRQRLKRRVDTRVFQHRRALERRRTQAIRDTKQALKAKDARREQALRAAQADKIRTELRARAQDMAPEARKQLRALLAKDDERLLQSVARHKDPEVKALHKMEATDEDALQVAAARAHREGVEGNQQLIGDEFGVGPHLASESKVAKWAEANRPGVDLVPFKVANRQWVAMPRVVKNRFDEHAAVTASPMLGRLNRATGVFKDVVLTSASPDKWLGGNVGDIGIRTLAEGITPLDIIRGRALDTRLQREGLQGQQASQALHQGGLYTTSGEGILGEPLGTSRIGGMSTAQKLNVPGHVWRAWKKGVYTVEHAIETIPLYGRTGKALRRDVGRRDQAPREASAPTVRATPDQFARAIAKVRGGKGYLTKYSKKDYQDMELHLAPDGKSGFALRGDELVNLFALPGAKFRGTAMLRAAEDRGAMRLDATSHAGAGLEKFYGDRGWKLDREEPWNPQYGSPPETGQRVVYMSRDVGGDAGMKLSLRSLLKLSEQQLDNYARGIATDRAMEARLQKNVEDVIGRWGKVSPTMRRTLTLAPFAQWLGAATRYVLVTLPVHHPIKTGVLAGVMQMTEAERKRLGLSYFAPLDQRAPDYQMGMLPIKVGMNKYGPVVQGVRTSRMTSFGTAASNPWNIPEFLMPQISSGLNALRGQSFTGEPLTYPASAGRRMEGLPMEPPDRLNVAIGAQAESMIPFASAFRRAILEQGRPSEPSSTILTPEVRQKFDYKNKRFYTPPAPGMWPGIREWLGPYVGPPFADLSRIYTLGAGRDIERSQQTMEQLGEWNKRRKAKAKARASYGPSPAQDDFWGGGPPHPNATPSPDQNDFWK